MRTAQNGSRHIWLTPKCVEHELNPRELDAVREFDANIEAEQAEVACD